MSAFTAIVIVGVLMILGGISLLATPLATFVSAGYFIILLFIITGIFGLIRGIREKRYDKDFFFSILSLILGVLGFVIPGAAVMNNFILLYMAACWFFVHGVLSIMTALDRKKQGAGTAIVVIGVLLGVVELLMGCYSVAHPGVLALSIGVLIGFYYIEAGVSMILVGSAMCQGSNNLTLLFTIMGVLTIIGGFSMIGTPLMTFMSIGHCIVILVFLNGVLGVVSGIGRGCYDKEFFFALVSLIVGVIGLLVPGIGSMNSVMLLYLAAGWFFIRGILSIIGAFAARKAGAGTGVMVIGILLGALELIMGCYSVAHPAVLALSLGILAGIYFIESGANMIFTGSLISHTVAIRRELRGGGSM